MNILITGAGGFLGKSVINSSVRRGHMVRAMIRPASTQTIESLPHFDKIKIVHADLRSLALIPEEIFNGIDCVIHLAASKTGDLYEQFGGTVIATENLLRRMAEGGVKRIIAISSFSVYEYLTLREWSMLEEKSPLASDPDNRDEYCQTKLEQERLIREWAAGTDSACILLRPGVLFGPDNLWTARLGMQLSEKVWIRTGTFAPLPLSYVDNCADAVVIAAEYNGKERELVLNVVDDEHPTQRAYINELKKQLPVKPFVIPIPWLLMRFLARAAWLANRLFFKGSAKIPGLFIPSRLHARCKPLRYTNEAITSVLDWTPVISWQEGVTKSVDKI